MTRNLIVRTLALLACLALVIVVSSAAGATSLAAETAYSVPIPGEPNDTFATASPIELYNRTYHYLMTLDDVDFFRLDLAAAHRVTPRVSVPQDSVDQPVLRVKLAMFDSAQQKLAEDADCGPDPILPEQRIGAGTYYLRVTACAGQFDPDQRYLPELGYPSQIEWEPNNSRLTANPFDDAEGAISPAGDVDFYVFSGQAGEQWFARLDTIGAGFPPGVNPEMALMTSDGTILQTSGPDYMYFQLPVTGDYYLRVRSATHPSGTGEYRLYGWGDGAAEPPAPDDIEPNDTIDLATPIEFGPVLDVFYDYPCDIDWFSFQGRAGDVLAYINTEYAAENVYLYASDGRRLSRVNVLPADGTYYLRAIGEYSDMHDWECYEGAETHRFGEALWVSAAVDGLGGDASIKKGDIVTRKNAPNSWQIILDASDVGITRNIVAFERMPNGSLLLSLDRPQTIAGLGKVLPQDIIRFSPTSLGDHTAGTFQWFLDGSDVGLTTTGEKIDVIIMQRDIENPLRISTTGSGSVPRVSGGNLKFRDEDLINFVGASYGPDSSGAWRLALDGSTVPGMAVEDLNAGTRVELYPQRTSDVLFGFATAFKIAGNPGTPKDVVFDESWRTAVKNLTDKPIDALGVGPVWTP